MNVDEQAARRAIAEKIAGPMGLSVEQAALGIIRIAVANMSRAIRSVSTEKGHDAREFVLFPFGGAGPLHAIAVAAECGINRVLVPVEPGTMCARGILLADVSMDLVRSELADATEANWPRVAERFAAMQASGDVWLDSERIPIDRRRFDRVIDARYKGQNHEVTVRLAGEGLERGAFIRAFEEAHCREYGYDIQGRAIEVVNCRVKAVGMIDRPRSAFAGTSVAAQPKSMRQVHFDEGWVDTPIFNRSALPVLTRIAGPAVIDEMSATTLVPPGSEIMVDRAGNLLLEIG
jgi:N-methylhydantoinase A